MSVIIVAFLLGSTGCKGQPNVAEGITAFNNKSYSLAAEILKANQDSPTAKFYLYRIFSNGLGVVKDKGQATQYLEQAAAEGNLEAMALQGNLLISKWKATPSQISEGLAMLTKAKDQGSRDAMVGLGGYYLKRPDEADALKGLDYLEKSNAVWQLAIAYTFGGPAFPRNQVKALEYWKAIEADPLANEGSRHAAAFYINEHYYYGAGVPANPALAAQRVAAQSDPDARSLYAWMLFRGDGGLKKDQEQAVQIWESLKETQVASSFLGGPYFTLGLGVAYQNGLGVSADPAKAEKMLSHPAVRFGPGAAWCIILWQEGLIKESKYPLTCSDKAEMTRAVMRDSLTPGPSRYKRLNTHALLLAANASAEQTSPRGWSYSNYTDKISGKESKIVTLASTNTHQLNFPYNGGTRGTLTLRKHPRYGKDVIFSVNKGQLLCSSDCLISIKFDDKKAYSVGASEPTDHSNNELFLSQYEYNKLLKNFKQSKKVLVEVTFFQEGARIFEFNTTDLKWD